MAGTVTFDNAPPPDTINLGLGQPSADILPLNSLQKACDAFFAEAQPIELNYGVIRGDQRYLDSLAALLTREYNAPTDPASLFLSAGNSQAIDFVASALTTPGDTILVEEPSYFLAFRIFKDYGLNIVGVPIDKDGLRIDVLQETLKKHRPSLLYTIPSFHNPTGTTMSATRRRELVKLSREHDFVILADEVYQMLYFDEPPPPALGTMIDEGNVVSLGSFSKILAPAMRLGWMQCSPGPLSRLTAAGLPNSGGSMNHFSSLVAHMFIDRGYQDEHLVLARRTLRARCAAMDQALRRHFGDIASWVKPHGGYFYWLEFDRLVDTAELKTNAAGLKTGFQPGSVFSSSGRLSHCLRLAFSHYNEDDIATGVRRLRTLFDQTRR